MRPHEPDGLRCIYCETPKPVSGIDQPVCVDLFCGLGGWTDGFKAAGFYVIGVDIVRYDQWIGDRFIQADIAMLDGRQFAGATVIVASPPCLEFSRFRQPWLRRRGNLPEPDLTLVKACWRIRDEAKPTFFLLENVQSAQQFIGRAMIAREPHYFWGDALLIPRVKMKQKQSYSGSQQAERARIPFELAYQVALSFAARGSR